MALDLNKSVMRKLGGERGQYAGPHGGAGGIGRVVGTIDATKKNIVVAFRYHPTSDPGLANKEYICCLSADELVNPPESRWLNVYAENEDGSYPRWTSSRASSDSVAADGRIAVIEDKQDGSDWIIHKVGN